jgi:pimeloyl-ACP methyl ester carboxylesterase
LTWSLDDYAAAIESALANQGITGGWLLGESFGSQLVWAMAARRRFEVAGVILAGGFVRHPACWAAKIAEKVGGRVPMGLITRMLFGYSKVARFRYRRSPEVLNSVDEFIARRRIALDREAAVHRLHLLAENDPCPVAGATNAPVYALTGALDPIVPWFRVRGWLRKHCRSLKDYKVIWRADHTVLATTPEPAAEQVIKWIWTDTSPAS